MSQRGPLPRSICPTCGTLAPLVGGGTRFRPHGDQPSCLNGVPVPGDSPDQELVEYARKLWASDEYKAWREEVRRSAPVRPPLGDKDAGTRGD